ncbi:MAG: response regulator transcription factor [Clostridiales bacterium]|nr:response regulator transcription factor [Clostridiales bacterium]
MATILIAEDDLSLNRLMKTVLEQHGYAVLHAQDGQDALMLMQEHHVDLIISDIMMPNLDGFELLECLRQTNHTMPVLFVTAKDRIEDKSRGFMSGVDDYMVKPIDIKELVLRVEALLRRSRIASEHMLTVGQTKLDSSMLTVTRNETAETLTAKEFQLLFKLLSYPNRIFTRMQIMDEIWGMDSTSDERTINVHISKLRNRFEQNPDFTIETVRGLGYKAVIR